MSKLKEYIIAQDKRLEPIAHELEDLILSLINNPSESSDEFDYFDDPIANLIFDRLGFKPNTIEDFPDDLIIDAHLEIANMAHALWLDGDRDWYEQWLFPIQEEIRKCKHDWHPDEIVHNSYQQPQLVMRCSKCGECVDLIEFESKNK